jgi:hypothetical protein
MIASRNRVLTLSLALTLALALLALLLSSPPSAASTLPAATATYGTVDIFPTYVANDGAVSAGSLMTGTPFLAHVAFTGLDPNTQYYGPKGYVPGSGFNWNNNTWKTLNATWTGYITFTTDASGAWSGWFTLCADATYTPTIGNFRAGCRKTDATTTLYTDYVSMTTMSIVTTGGWVEGHAYGVSGTSPSGNRSAAPLVGHHVVVRDSGSTIMGIYATEDNGVAEGYDSGDTGYYKIAVPAGSGYTAEVWDANNAIIGSSSTPFTVTAEATTSSVDINAAPPEADLAITKSAPATVLAGATLTYTLAFTHTNAFPGAIIFVTDTIPANVTWHGSNPSPTASSGRDYTWMFIPMLPSPYTGTIAITTSVGGGVAAGTILTNTAGITATVVDTNPANNFACTTTKVGYNLYLPLLFKGYNGW